MPKRKKHKAVIIEGNPYYLNSESKQNYRRYYDEIKDNLHNAGYDDVVFDPGEDYTTPPSADLWVGHSRGAGRLRFAPKGTRTLDITQYEDGIEEYKALMAKEMKKRGYKSVRDFPAHLRPVPGPEHHTLTQRAKDAIMMHKVGERKKHSVKHTLVTGHSGAGKSTLARSFGLPIHALDDDPDIREQLKFQMAYARENDGRLPLGEQYAKPMRSAEKRAIDRALALKDPHVIDGSYLLNRDPEEFRAHNTHLVDTPEDVVLDRRVERQRVKDLARNRRWDDERAKGVRMRGQQLIDEYAPGVKRWRGADYVKKASFQSLSSMRREAKQNKYITRRRFLKHLIRETAELSTTEKSNYVKRLAKDVSGLPKLASKEGVATKTDPAKWARAKAQARAKMGGKHSARAMQLATQIYKKNGGGYSGAKPSSGTNKLKKWTKQKWQWSGKDTAGPGGTGVYLPKRSSEQLKSTRAGRDKLRAASAAKRAATNSGRQFSSHGLHVGKKRSDVR